MQVSESCVQIERVRSREAEREEGAIENQHDRREKKPTTDALNAMAGHSPGAFKFEIASRRRPSRHCAPSLFQFAHPIDQGLVSGTYP
jgi:hypothetical protein